MSNVRQSSLYNARLFEIWQYIADDNLAAADRLVDMVDQKLQQYANQPEMGDVRPELGTNIRYFVVGQYVVYYQPVDDGIAALLIIHGARDSASVIHQLKLQS